MKVIEYIKNLGLEALKENKAIKVREYDDRIVLNYNQIDSPKFDKITQECRGLILSWPNLDILSRSFDRFFNYGEGSTPKKIKDWSGYIGYEKLDGSLINVYWDFINNEWIAATRGMAFAEGNTTYGDGKLFQDIIHKSVNDGTDYESLEELCEDSFDKDYTYIFEVVSPETRVVKPYNEYRLILLAVRNKITGDYVSDKDLEVVSQTTGIRLPIFYEFDTIEDCVKSSTEMDSPFDEGYVLWNPNTNHRIKVKNPAYVAIAHMRQDGVLSEKRIVLLIFKNDQAEYLNLFPEDQKFFDPYIEAYGKLKIEVNKTWEANRYIADQREFAMQVKDTKVKTFMFNMRKGVSIGATIERMTDSTKLEILKRFINGKGN